MARKKGSKKQWNNYGKHAVRRRDTIERPEKHYFIE
jgi:hypothetical protein